MKKQNIEEQLKELEKLVDWFEAGEVNIDEALPKYEAAMKLAQKLEKDIKAAENKFTKIQKSFSKGE